MVIAILCCALAFVLAAAAGLLSWLDGDRPVHGLVLLGVGATLALAGFWVLFGLVDDHFSGLERLRGRLVMMRAEAGSGARVDPSVEPWRQDAEGGRLADAAFGLVQLWRQTAQAPDARLTALVAAVPEPMVAVTETGVVSLINAGCLAILGGDRARPGTSIYAALDDRDLDAARRVARAQSQPARAALRHAEGHLVTARVVDLGPGHGALLMFAADAPSAGAAGPLLHDLSLHEAPPTPRPVSDETPLDALSAWVLDLETTGLDPRTCRIVSIGAIRQHGGRLYRGTTIDQLVNPGAPIPAASTAIHGITDPMVETAPGFGDILPQIERLLAGCAMVGHNIGFDLAVLASEAARCGRSWPTMPALDTVLLVAALEPQRTDLNLEAIATDWGVPAAARHTALGDCLIAGEVYARLLPRLAERGITSYGAARAFSRTATRAYALQRSAGWALP
ncbi:MAG: exonuclease domain-containing protein [Alphaproteobacteria bacterium]